MVYITGPPDYIGFIRYSGVLVAALLLLSLPVRVLEGHNTARNPVTSEECLMATVDLKQWPQFRKESLKLSADLELMVKEIDAVMSLGISDSAKALETSSIVDSYLPEGCD